MCRGLLSKPRLGSESPPVIPSGETPLSVLELESITKRFGTTLALDGASLQIRSGTVHALLGENGAGKTTLMRIAFGMIAPDTGTIRVDGVPRQWRSPADAIAAGIGMVHQHFMLVPAMTVTENIALGGHGRYHTARVRQRIQAVSERTGLRVDPDALVSTLSVGAQQRVEILKALVRDARILVLDEPTAVLTPAEARELLRYLRTFAEQGGSVVLITHKLRDAIELADEVTVLRKGRLVLSAPAQQVTVEQLTSAMIGEGASLDERRENRHDAHEPAARAQAPFRNEVVLALDDVTVRDDRGIERLRQVNLRVHAGELLGIVAVEGNGQAELVRLLAGRLETSTGRVQRPALVGFIPEDRHRDGLILDFPLYENNALFGAGQRHGIMPWQTISNATLALMRTYDVRTGTDHPSTAARTLSGGNQQKLIVGRELEGIAREPFQALVAENPTRGLDVNASAFVHQRLRAARDAGAAVVVYSSDLDEVIALADRLVVVYNGTVHEAPHDRELVGRMMLGSTVTESAEHRS